MAKYPELVPSPNPKTPTPVPLNHLWILTLLMTMTTMGATLTVSDGEANLVNRNDG